VLVVLLAPPAGTVPAIGVPQHVLWTVDDRSYHCLYYYLRALGPQLYVANQPDSYHRLALERYMLR
jgi:hypothetical protein